MAITYADVMALSDEEFNDLVGFLGKAQRERGARKRSEFKFNQTVKFKDKNGNYVYCMVKSFGPKNIVVTMLDRFGDKTRQGYRVPPSMLEDASDHDFEEKLKPTPPAALPSPGSDRVSGSAAGTF